MKNISGTISGTEVSSSKSYIPFAIYLIIFLLGLWGCLAVCSATIYMQEPFYFTGRQILWLLASTLALALFAKIPFSFFRETAAVFAALFYIPLISVLFWGAEVNGMRGWFDTGFFFIQPSELAKPAFVLLLCSAVDKSRTDAKIFLTTILVTLLWICPIIGQPDYGTATVYVLGFLALLFLSGIRLLYFAPLTLVFLSGFIYALTKKAYLLSRITGFLDPGADPFGSGWHILQFNYAVARGGLWGSGWGNCLWANAYLPLSYSDSSFAALAEALGFIGSAPVIVGFGLLAWAAFRISAVNQDPFKKLFISSMMFMIVIQALMHISVNTGMMPPTGITLPLFSYGGSSLLSTMIAAGMIISAAESPDKIECMDDKDKITTGEDIGKSI